MNCFSCPFASPFYSFGGHNNVDFGVKCEVLGSDIFRIAKDEATMLPAPLDYARCSHPERTSLWDVFPGVWAGFDEYAWDEERTTAMREVFGCECVAEAGDIANYVDEHRELLADAQDKLARFADEVEHYKDRLCQAARLMFGQQQESEFTNA